MVNLRKEERRLIRIALASLLDDCAKANQLVRPEEKVDLSPIQSLLLKFDEDARPEKTQEDASRDFQPEFPWRVKL